MVFQACCPAVKLRIWPSVVFLSLLNLQCPHTAEVLYLKLMFTACQRFSRRPTDLNGAVLQLKSLQCVCSGAGHDCQGFAGDSGESNLLLLQYCAKVLGFLSKVKMLSKLKPCIVFIYGSTSTDLNQIIIWCELTLSSPLLTGSL